MKSDLKAGLARTKRITVDKARSINFLGEDLRVYATPELVRDVETICREFLLDHCDPGEDSVGTGVQISHRGATLLGMGVDITIAVKEVEGRKVTFSVSARDAVEEVMRGEHGRFVVDVEKLRSRVAAKAAKAGND